MRGGLWKAVDGTGARDLRGVAECLPFLVGNRHLSGLQGSKPELDQGPGCLSQPTAPHMGTSHHTHTDVCMLSY